MIKRIQSRKAASASNDVKNKIYSTNGAGQGFDSEKFCAYGLNFEPSPLSTAAAGEGHGVPNCRYAAFTADVQTSQSPEASPA